MKNDFYVGMYEDTYLAHTAKGTSWSDHEYISRVWKNGHWNYIYDYNNPLLKSMAKKPEASINTSKSTAKITTTSSTKKTSKNSVARASSSTKKSSKSSSTKKKKSSSSRKKSSSKKSSGSSKQATEKIAASESKLQNKKQQNKKKTVNGKKVKTFSVMNNTNQMMKAINKYKDGSSGYIFVNGKVYLWNKSGGKLTFNVRGDTKSSMDQQSVVNEINEMLKKKKNWIAVDKNKK